MKSLALNSIPGLAEAMARAKAKQFRTREDSLLGLTHDLCGVTVRTMTIRDYVLLDRFHSPFIHRMEPTQRDLAFFLWLLSPGFEKWCNGAGWRKWFPFLQPVAAFFHGRRVRSKFCRHCPESSEPVVLKCFEYIDKMFFDSPPALRGGGESCTCYLTGWFDSLQSEYHFDSEKIWAMGLPELFQRLNAIRQRTNPSVPNFNKNTDDVKAFVLRGLRGKEFTMDDLAAGRVKFPDNVGLN